MYLFINIVHISLCILRIACTLTSTEDRSSMEELDDIFDQFSENISGTRLRMLLRNIDMDLDGKITKSELKGWIGDIRKRHAQKMAKTQLSEYDNNKDQRVTMEEYFQYIYGNKSDGSQQPSEEVLRAKQCDEKRWNHADLNHDGVLSIEELAAFEIPEDFEYMKNYFIEETFDSLDRNIDGRLSLAEFTGLDAVNNTTLKDEDGEISFKERYFKQLKDRNQDGFLDLNEVETLLAQSYSSRITSETNGFMKHLDQNKDGVLTTDEILENWDNFNGVYPNFEDVLLQHEEL